MNTKTKQIYLADIEEVAEFLKGNTFTHSQRLLAHAQKHGLKGIVIFETVWEDCKYWMIGEKIEEDKWKVSLVYPKGTFIKLMGEKTDDEFNTVISDVDGHTHPVLIVESLDLVPMTLENMDFKFKHLSKKVEKKMNRIWPF